MSTPASRGVEPHQPEAPAHPASGLEITNLTVKYGAATAVNDVTLHLPAGQIIALLGPSGSGKSSLLRAVAGLEPVVTGDISWQGQSVVRTPVHRRGFGLMFQDGQLFAHRNVAGNVGYGLAGRSRTERQARVAAMLELVGLADYDRRAVTSLSGGQAQRVALARALAPHPRLLLLDEPLSALDRALRERLAVDIRKILRDNGTTAMYVTHDQDEAFTVADTIGILIDGELVRHGSPADVWAEPQRADVARFLGYGPIREHEGQLRAYSPQALSIPTSPPTARAPLATPTTTPPLTTTPAGQETDSQLIALEVTIREVRMRRGYAQALVTLPDGEAATARLASVTDSSHPGQRCQALLDLDRCPVVSH